MYGVARIVDQLNKVRMLFDSFKIKEFPLF